MAAQQQRWQERPRRPAVESTEDSPINGSEVGAEEWALSLIGIRPELLEHAGNRSPIPTSHRTEFTMATINILDRQVIENLLHPFGTSVYRDAVQGSLAALYLLAREHHMISKTEFDLAKRHHWQKWD
jgi:hypothetical protein